YMLPFNSEQYFESNWLKGEIQISKDGQTKVIRLETLQVEELMQFSDWIEQLTDKEKRTQTIFNFIDPMMKFRLWKRGRTETIRFIYHSEQKDTYSWEMILSDENVTDFKRQINEILVKFPIR
ncbi:MAG: hypothetical protein WCK03_03400, partial [Candidatus Taylorbacteria bacterium]